MATMRRSVHACAAVLLAVAIPSTAKAQDSRAEELAAEQAEKSAALHPYEPNSLEKRLIRLERLFLDPPPVYAYVGSVLRGGWMAVGPGYRGTLGDLSRYDVHGAWSLKNYKTVDGFVRLSEIGDGQVRIDLRGSWLDAPEVSFWGTGDGSSPENKTSYRHRATTAGAVARFQATKVFAVGGGFDATAYDIGHGAGATSVEERFSLEELPGLSVNTNYIKTQVFAEADSRRSPGYTRRGGLYRVEWHEYRETSNGPFSFHRFDAEVNQFLPVLRENWVIALRALTTLTGTDTGQRVPFFLLPDLGGGRELRGYSSWRFRDRQRILLTAEYRWTAGNFVDMALFLDAGKVVAEPSDVNLDGLRTTYGIGVRFHTPLSTVMRVEFAHTDEGNGVVFAFGPSF